MGRILNITASIIAIIFFIAIISIRSPSGKVIWMQEGQEINAVERTNVSGVHPVLLFDVAAGQNRTDKLCGFIVDGDYIMIPEGDDREINGITIYVRRVVSVRDQLQDKDVCKVAFGGPIIISNDSEIIVEEENNTAENAITSTTAEQQQDQNNSQAEENMVGVTYNPLKDNIMTSAESVDVGQAKPETEKPARIGIIRTILGWLKGLFLADA